MNLNGYWLLDTSETYTKLVVYDFLSSLLSIV